MKWEVKAGWNFSARITRDVIGQRVGQHPSGEKPSITVIFAEPPSVVGIDGGQMVDDAPGAAAAELVADCVELSSPSPGNSRGACELREAGALIPLELPPAVLDVDDPLVVVADVPAANEPNGSGEAGTLSGSVPVPVAVWAWAVVMMPRRAAAVRIVRCIAFSCLRAIAELALQDNARSIEKKNEV